jgi:hypothetical protein
MRSRKGASGVASKRPSQGPEVLPDSRQRIVITDPGNRDSYLRDPNYYRLGYQLAAQLLNGSLVGMVPPPDTRLPEHAQGLVDDQGITPASHVIEGARRMVQWYEHRARKARYRPWVRKLSPTELRMMRFLSETVEPSSELLIAHALLLQGRKTEAEGVVRRVRSGRRLSYRAHYNFACYEAGRAKIASSYPEGADVEDALQESFDHLTSAIEGAPPEKQGDLARWAKDDPALKPLVEANKRFAAQFRDLTTLEDGSEEETKADERPDQPQAETIDLNQLLQLRDMARSAGEYAGPGDEEAAYSLVETYQRVRHEVASLVAGTGVERVFAARFPESVTWEFRRRGRLMFGDIGFIQNATMLLNQLAGWLDGLIAGLRRDERDTDPPLLGGEGTPKEGL